MILKLCKAPTMSDKSNYAIPIEFKFYYPINSIANGYFHSKI